VERGRRGHAHTVVGSLCQRHRRRRQQRPPHSGQVAGPACAAALRRVRQGRDLKARACEVVPFCSESLRAPSRRPRSPRLAADIAHSSASASLPSRCAWSTSRSSATSSSSNAAANSSSPLVTRRAGPARRSAR
jgi:hypothetical protein